MASDELRDTNQQMVAVSCSGCDRQYLKRNATVLSETMADGEVIDPDDDHERCPFCGQTTESSPKVPVALDFSDGGEE